MEEKVTIIDFDDITKRREEYFKEHPEILENLRKSCEGKEYEVTIVGKDFIKTIKNKIC